MCRMIAITTKNIDPQLTFIMVDRGLLASLADDKGQTDGYGIATSNGILVKGAGSYRDADLWFKPSSVRTPIIGHIRAASPATGKSEKEAHPYYFDKAAVPFLLQHNGNVAPSFGIATPPFPATDSYAAGQELEKLVNEHKRLDASVILEWAKEIKETNPFVFFILADDVLYILRGNKERTMYYLKYNDGYIFHTSPYALINIVAYCLELKLAVFEQQTIQEVPVNTLLVVRGNEITHHPLQLAKDERHIVLFHNNAWYYGTWQDTSWQNGSNKKQEKTQTPTEYPNFFQEPKEEKEKKKALASVAKVMSLLKFAPTFTLASYLTRPDTEEKAAINELFLLSPDDIKEVVDNIKKWNEIVRRDTEFDFLLWLEYTYSDYSDFMEDVIPVYCTFSDKQLREVYKEFMAEQAKEAKAAGNAAEGEKK